MSLSTLNNVRDEAITMSNPRTKEESESRELQGNGEKSTKTANPDIVVTDVERAEVNEEVDISEIQPSTRQRSVQSDTGSMQSTNTDDDQDEFDMNWAELKLYRKLCNEEIQLLRAIIDSKPTPDQMNEVQARKASVDKLTDKVKEISDAACRSPHADVNFKARERDLRVELTEAYIRVSSETNAAIGRMRDASGNAERVRSFDNLETPKA